MTTTSTTVGTAPYTFQYVKDWPKLPSWLKLGAVSAIATDSQDRVYIFHRADPPVVICAPDGAYLNGWGNGSFEYAHGFYIANDIVYLTDRNTSVCIMYTLDGKPIQMLGKHGVHSDTGCEKAGDLCPRAAGPFNYPTEMVPHPSGDLFVSDGYRNARVHRFDPEGHLKYSWGQPGKTGRGEFHLPHSLVLHEGLLYVCDRENHRLQVFTTEGEHVSTWTDIQRPMDISVDPEGSLVVSEGSVKNSSARVSVLDREGNVLSRFNCRGPGHGSWVDSHGDIYVGLSNPGGVDKFVRRSGRR
jgi:DNA-binding beta-propeller fold protein YncE